MTLRPNNSAWWPVMGAAALGVIYPGVIAAQPVTPGEVSAADTAWVLMSSALVLAMIVPGLALFYGGLVRSKNVLGTIMQSFVHSLPCERAVGSDRIQPVVRAR